MAHNRAMPVLDIRALPQEDPSRIPDALSAACRAVAEVYGCAPRQVWAIWTEIPAGHYVEGDVAANFQPKDSHPPIVRLLCFEGQRPETIARLLEAAADALCDALDLPGNIFIEYSEGKSGQIIAGNGIVRR